MIIDKINNLALYENINPLFAKASHYLNTTDFVKLEPGKHPIDGENVFAICMEYDTKEENACLLENHHTYIDVQYIIEGEELIGVSLFNGQPIHTPYDEYKEVAFYKGKPDFMIKLPVKHFAIFFTDDLHMPCIKVNQSLKVKKVVLKIRASYN